MSNFTPGPWETVKRKDWIDVMSANDSRIVSVDTDDEQYAMPDANLIAAAPELYSALKNLVQTMEQAIGPFMTEAKDALAKAEGKS